MKNGLVIPVESENPYEYDYFLNYFSPDKKEKLANENIIRKKETISRLLEGSISKASTCFWIKPNKFDKKGRLIDERGRLIIDEADQMILIDNYETLCYSFGRSIMLLKHQFRLENESVSKIKAQSNAGYKNNVFIPGNQCGIRTFDAGNGNWLITPQPEIKQIHYLEKWILRFKK